MAFPATLSTSSLSGAIGAGLSGSVQYPALDHGADFASAMQREISATAAMQAPPAEAGHASAERSATPPAAAGPAIAASGDAGRASQTPGAAAHAPRRAEAPAAAGGASAPRDPGAGAEPGAPAEPPTDAPALGPTDGLQGGPASRRWRPGGALARMGSGREAGSAGPGLSGRASEIREAINQLEVDRSATGRRKAALGDAAVTPDPLGPLPATLAHALSVQTPDPDMHRIGHDGTDAASAVSDVTLDGPSADAAGHGLADSTAHAAAADRAPMAGPAAMRQALEPQPTPTLLPTEASPTAHASSAGQAAAASAPETPAAGRASTVPTAPSPGGQSAASATVPAPALTGLPSMLAAATSASVMRDAAGGAATAAPSRIDAAASSRRSASKAEAPADEARPPRHTRPETTEAASPVLAQAAPSIPASAPGALQAAGAETGGSLGMPMSAAAAASQGPSAGAALPSPAAVTTFGRIDWPIDQPGFGPALGAQVSLMVRDGLQQATLQLNPAEMGPIMVQIAVDGSAARVNFQAEVAATRAAIEASLPALAGALLDAGMTLSGGGVTQPQAASEQAAGGMGQGQTPGQAQSQAGGQAMNQQAGQRHAEGGTAGAAPWRGPGEPDAAASTAAARAAMPTGRRGLIDLVA